MHRPGGKPMIDLSALQSGYKLKGFLLDFAHETKFVFDRHLYFG